MRQHTMLDAQQNYNTNYLNNNIGHSRPPIASEPVGKCFNMNLDFELNPKDQFKFNPKDVMNL